MIEGGRSKKTPAKVKAASPGARKAVAKHQVGKRQPTKRQSAKPKGSFGLRGETRGPAPTVGPRAQRTTALLMAQTLLFQSDEYRDKVNAFSKRRER